MRNAEIFALGADCSPWEFDSAVANHGNGEVGEGGVLTQLKSNPVFSPQSLKICFLDFLHH